MTADPMPSDAFEIAATELGGIHTEPLEYVLRRGYAAMGLPPNLALAMCRKLALCQREDARRSADARVAAAVQEERDECEQIAADEMEGLPSDHPEFRTARDIRTQIANRPNPTGTDPLAALLAEAREAGIREAAEAASQWGKIFDDTHWCRVASAADDIAEMLLSKIPTPEAPRDE